jgi:signal transduction histidine kinase
MQASCSTTSRRCCCARGCSRTPSTSSSSATAAWPSPPSTPTIARGDKWALECVVANLRDNALRAEPPGGVVDVRVLPSAIVEIADHGAGVSDADRDRIFEPFWRRDAKGHGTGLGLAISKTLAELMGGSISIVETCGGGAIQLHLGGQALVFQVVEHVAQFRPGLR